MNTGRPEAGAHYAALYNTAQTELAALREEVTKLKLQLEPRTVSDVIGFAYIEKMSARQIHNLLTQQHTELEHLRSVMKEVADAFDGGPEHPWIPGFNAKPIYNKVMLATISLRSAQSGEPPQ